ncbi:MAG: prolipoprotein diacylglyceryl transferase [Clostridia bacterium]|nr:prolipoprotein diacylglyceryl transferase [Clostridia bacterium]
MNTQALLDHPGIKIGEFTITYYALCIVCGMIIAFILISLLFKRRNMSPDLFLTIFVICLPICLVTTRLFYCITDGMPIEEWFAWDSLQKGGLSIIGGILGGIISIFVVCLIKKVPFFRVTDCVVVGLLVAQACGRWGNFFNQEVYGAEVTNEALQFFPIAVFIDNRNAWHYAFFFYESTFNLIVAALLFWNGWKNGKKPNGVNSALYCTSYGLVRSIMEPLRDPTYILNGGGVPWSLVTSILLLVGGLAWLFAVLFVNKRKEGTLFGSLNGDPYGISEFIKDSKNEVPKFSKINMMCAVYPERYETQEDKTENATDGGNEEQ